MTGLSEIRCTLCKPGTNFGAGVQLQCTHTVHKRCLDRARAAKTAQVFAGQMQIQLLPCCAESIERLRGAKNCGTPCRLALLYIAIAAAGIVANYLWLRSVSYD